MATLQSISSSLLLAEAYYVELLAEYIVKLVSGRLNPEMQKKLICLNRLIRALSWDTADSVNDATTTQLYTLLLEAIAPYPGSSLTVNPNVVIPTNPIVYNSSTAYRLPLILTTSDFEVDAVTFNDTDLAGLNQFLVYLNGVRYLLPGVDFNYLTTGGIVLIEPIYSGQQIILIF